VVLAEGPLTILALGPLTTIAAALCQSDMALHNISEIVFGGGRRLGLEFKETPTQAKPFRG
jgi:inosine-uridine nucleoside N-ribohydrolase